MLVGDVMEQEDASSDSSLSIELDSQDEVLSDSFCVGSASDDYSSSDHDDNDDPFAFEIDLSKVRAPSFHLRHQSPQNFPPTPRVITSPKSMKTKREVNPASKFKKGSETCLPSYLTNALEQRASQLQAKLENLSFQVGGSSHLS